MDIPEWLCMKGWEKESTDHEQENGNWELIELYLLLRIIEYAIAYDKKQKQKSRPRDIVLFNKDKGGYLRQLGQKVTDEEIMESKGSTMILINQRRGHTNALTHHKTNVEPYINPVRALGRIYAHLRRNRENGLFDVSVIW